jgi:hypothetical protein
MNRVTKQIASADVSRGIEKMVSLGPLPECIDIKNHLGIKQRSSILSLAFYRMLQECDRGEEKDAKIPTRHVS